jgi:hypothetical protein
MLARRVDRESYYNYDPSVGAAIVFAVLYGIAFVGTVVQWIRFRPVIWLVMVISAASTSISFHFNST